MKKSPTKPGRPDIEAAVRGGDWTQPMDGEGPLAYATLKQARYWTHIYTEILAMEEKVLQRIQQLMAAQSAEARREVEITNVPVVVAQAERFRQRLGYWEARVRELDGVGPAQVAKARGKGRTGKQSAATTSPMAMASTRRRPSASRRLSRG
jgi:hypothetical protein